MRREFAVYNLVFILVERYFATHVANGTGLPAEVLVIAKHLMGDGYEIWGVECGMQGCTVFAEMRSLIRS